MICPDKLNPIDSYSPPGRYKRSLPDTEVTGHSRQMFFNVYSYFYTKQNQLSIDCLRCLQYVAFFYIINHQSPEAFYKTRNISCVVSAKRKTRSFF